MKEFTVWSRSKFGPTPDLIQMTLSDVLARIMVYLLVLIGLVGGLVYGGLAADDRHKHNGIRQILNWTTAIVCWYVAILWGGQEAGLWTISPAFGRPALLVALGALTWKGILSWGPRGR